MKIRILIVLIINALCSMAWFPPAFALQHVQKDGLFIMDIPSDWHWNDYPREILITYPDGKTVAMDIQFVPSKLTPSGIKKAIKEGNDTMIKEGIIAHHGTLFDNIGIKLDGVYATKLDFRTAPPHPVDVTYISLVNKGYAYTFTYGSSDDKMISTMDDILSTLKFR